MLPKAPEGTVLSVHRAFERHAARRPDAVALVHRDHSISYAALRDRARGWAGRLAGAGVRPGDLVGVHLDRTPDLVAAFLGVFMAGGGYVPLDPSYPADRIRYMIDDCAPAALITAGNVAAGGVPVLRPGGLGHPGPSLEVSGAQVAYVLYTSGSTGSPKGVPLTHAGALSMLRWAAEAFGDDLTRVLASTSVCFDCSILELFGPLTQGGTAVLVDSVMDIGTRPDGYEVRLLHSVPSVIEELLRSDRLPPTVQTGIVGGEALWATLAERIYARSSITRLVNLYGPTEYTSYTTMAVIEPVSTGAAPPIGRPITDARVHLLESSGTEVEPGEPGEIAVAGPGLAQGYLRRPGLTAERFVPEPFTGLPGQRMYRTGDLGVAAADGNLHFLGRIDDQVKVRGVRIEPGEVEHAILGHPAVREAVVVAAEEPGGQVALTAYVVGEADPEQLRAYLRRRLPSPLVPSQYVGLERLPRMPNGKIDRRRLPVPQAVVACAATPSGVPETQLQAVLAQLWAESAGVPSVDIDADLFDLGGHSLPALRVRARVAELLGIDVPLRVFFEQTTVARLAKALSGYQASPPPTPPPDPASKPNRRALGTTQLTLLRRNESGDVVGLAQPLVVRLAGPIEPIALRDAVRNLVRRHAILGSVVSASEGDPHWRAALTPPLRYADFSGLGGSAVAASMAAVQAQLKRSWSLYEEPPMRTFILRLAPEDHVICVLLHAIAADAWTVETVSHQLLELYADAIGGRPVAGAPVIQYADWAAERMETLASPAGAAQRRFWSDVLDRAPVLRLPGDSHRSTEPGPASQHIFVVLGEQVEELTRIAREEGATPYMALVAAFAVFLSAQSGQSGLVIGCPTSGRLRPELGRAVGPFMDALPLRCDLAGLRTFREVLRHVRETALPAYANDAVPFVEMAALRASDVSRHPVFQATVVLQQRPSLLDPSFSAEVARSFPIGEVEIAGFLDLPPITSLDVELAFFERDGDWEGVLTCRGDVVSAEEVPGLAQELLATIARAASSPDGSIETAPASSDTK